MAISIKIFSFGFLEVYNKRGTSIENILFHWSFFSINTRSSPRLRSLSNQNTKEPSITAKNKTLEWDVKIQTHLSYVWPSPFIDNINDMLVHSYFNGDLFAQLNFWDFFNTNLPPLIFAQKRVENFNLKQVQNWMRKNFPDLSLSLWISISFKLLVVIQCWS